MEKFKAWWPIIVFAVTFFIGYGILQADAKNLDKRVSKTETKVEILTTSTDKMDVKQEAIKEDIGDVDKKLDKLIELMLEQKEKEKERRPR